MSPTATVFIFAIELRNSIPCTGLLNTVIARPYVALWGCDIIIEKIKNKKHNKKKQVIETKAPGRRFPDVLEPGFKNVRHSLERKCLNDGEFHTLQ